MKATDVERLAFHVYAEDRPPMRQNISAMLADEVQRALVRETAYQQAKAKALAQLSAPFRLGGSRMSGRETLHDRQNLR
jgi:hypothetical protein